jgi:formylglycine-generating enzyme
MSAVMGRGQRDKKAALVQRHARTPINELPLGEGQVKTGRLVRRRLQDMMLTALLRSPFSWVLATGALLLGTFPAPREAAAKGAKCPKGMVSIDGEYCIDKYEASTVEIVEKNKTQAHSSYLPIGKLKVKAVSRKGRVPQAYISRDQAADACVNAGKRLCSDDEWVRACKGKSPTSYPYGDDHKAGHCNDGGRSSFNALYGVSGGPAPQGAYTFANLNDERLNKMPGTLAATGAYEQCRSSYGVHDMVGNLHEWTAAKAATFRGGYYLDSRLHGDGCDYKTTAHAPHYHDYSTGFRCCK